MSEYNLNPTAITDVFSRQVRDNLFLNYQEYRDKKTVLKSYPIKLYVEPTQRCNLNCITCSPDRRREKEDMSMDLFRRIEEELFPYVAEVSLFLTGEPTLASNFSQMLEISQKYTFFPRIFTNGMLLSDDIAERLVDSGCLVTVSFDAASPQLFKNIRLGADLDTILANIKRLQKIQARIGNRRFHLRLGTTLGLHNIDEASRVIELVYRNGITDVMFGCLDSGAFNVNNMLLLDPERSVSALQAAMALADKYKIRLSHPKKIGNFVFDRHNNWSDFVLPVDRYAPFHLESLNPYEGDCGYPWTQAAIRSNGLVVSCCQREHLLGDYKESDFHEIWNGVPYMRLRSQKNYRVCRNVICNMVDYTVLNGGGCRANGKKINQKWWERLRDNCFFFVRSVLFGKAAICCWLNNKSRK